ncbi:MAG: DNA primase, partial [Devosiaceae bacterium]|nr:DNA primase [Devosiaceae bacterium]
KGDMWACCPFHSEKTPSFHADDRRGRYYCFSCEASGDHFRFLTEKTGVPFPEAVERLANLAGVAMPARDEKAEKREQERRSLFDVMEMAAKYFEAALSDNIGARARGYLHERNITPAMQTHFRIGFAPQSRNGLKEHLAQNGVLANDLIATGLVVHGDDIAVPYDRFRNRVMFPIKDFRGRIIAFGGRALSSDVPAKYLNSPETELFHKRKTLYNGQGARQAAYDGKPLIVVEGYTDVIALVGAGFEASVAPLGTALTTDHLGLLWRMKDVPILCFDGDIAGKKAAARVVDVALERLSAGKSIRFVTLPEGQDPDDIIVKQGRDIFAKMIDSALPLSQMVFNLEAGGVVPQTPEARAALELRLKKRTAMIADQSVRHHYVQAFNEKLREFFAPSYIKNKGQYSFNSNKKDKRGAKSIAASDALKNSALLKPSAKQSVSAREASIIICLVNHPDLTLERLETLANIEFESKQASEILSLIIDIVADNSDILGEELSEKIAKKGFAKLLEKMQKMLDRQGIWQSGAQIAKIDAETGLKHALALHYKSVQLNRELKAAEIALGNDLSEENLEKLRDIQNQIATVDGKEALIEGFGSLSGRTAQVF